MMRKILFAGAVVAGLAGCAGGTVPPVVVTGCADLSKLQPVLDFVTPVLGPYAPAVEAAEALLNAGCADAQQLATAIANLEAALEAVGAVNHAAQVRAMVAQ